MQMALLMNGSLRAIKCAVGQRDNWLRVTLPPASDGAIMRAILKEYMARQ